MKLKDLKTKLPKMTKEKWINMAIYIALIIAVTIYVAIAFRNPDNNNNKNNETVNEYDDSSTDEPDINIETDKPTHELPYNDSTHEPTSNESEYKYPEGNNIYLDDREQKSKCRVYIPSGYTYSKKWDNSIVLKPEDLSLTVEGNSAITVGWYGFMHMDKLHDNIKTFTDEFKTYTILDKYTYAYNQSNTTDVYVIQTDITELIHKEDPEDPNNIISENVTHTSYSIIVDYNLEGAIYPIVKIDSDDIHNILNNRYSNIISIAKAIFKPLE